MVGTIFQYVGLIRGPIQSMEDLVEGLSMHKDLLMVEEMEKVMSKKGLLPLLDKFVDISSIIICIPSFTIPN